MDIIRNIKISSKLTISFAILIAISLIMAIVAFTAVRTIEQAEQDTATARDLGHTYLRYQATFADQRQGLLFYLLTGDRSGLAQFNDLAPEVMRVHASLRELAVRDEKISSLVDQLDAHYQSWNNQYAAEQIRLMRNYLTVNQARAIEVTGEPQSVIGEFETVAHELRQILETISAAAKSRQESALAQFQWTIIISIFSLIVAAILLGLLLTRSIARPIGRMTHVMGDLAGGNLETEIQGADRKDEIGGMALAVEVFKQNAIEQRRLQAADAEKQQQERQRHVKMEALTKEFDEKMGNGLRLVSRSMELVASSSETMAGNATETGTLSQTASAAVEQTGMNIQTVSSATTELSSSIGEISRQMTETSRVSNEAVTEIEQTNQRVIALNEAAASIGQVVQIISDIAEQTNLLALNATIESARAGEAGKGFAVVASEVKNLANQTGQATEDIRRQIQEIQGETQSAAQAVLEIGETIRKVNDLTASIASAVEEQGAATNEIARNVEEASSGTNQVSEVVQEVATAAEETGKLAESQNEVVAELNQNNDRLKDDIDQFLKDVNAL